MNLKVKVKRDNQAFSCQESIGENINAEYLNGIPSQELHKPATKESYDIDSKTVLQFAKSLILLKLLRLTF